MGGGYLAPSSSRRLYISCGVGELKFSLLPSGIGFHRG